MLALSTSSDLTEFAAIPAKWRTKVDAWIKTLQQLDSGLITKAEAIQIMRVDRSTFDRKLKAVEEHGWRGLVPAYKTPTPLCNDFVDYWKTLQEKYQRKTAAAIRELHRRWKDRQPIPGYTGHPGWPELPAGWDSRNLYRYQPSKLSLTTLRHGAGRAHMLHAPKVLSTRVGLHHLSHLIADDVKLDMKGHILNSRQMCVPMQLGFMDLRSGARFKWGTKPRLTRKDGTQTGIAESDMRFLLCGQLLETGLSMRGTTYLLEHGTATLRDRVIDILTKYYGPKGLIYPGAFHVSKSGMLGDVQHICGLSDGRGGKGNPFFKAWLESLHNLMHNELAALPAQTGHDRDEPEHLGVITRENDMLFRLAQRLDPQHAAMLKLPTLEFHTQLVPAINHILGIINDRTDHNLEGWAESGFITKSYRLAADSQEWKTDADLMLLPAPVRDAYLHMAAEDKRCFLPRKLSPAEVFSMGQRSAETVAVPQSVIAEILYEDLARPERVDHSAFSFMDAEIAPHELHYESRVLTPQGREIELSDRETYEVVCNPFDLRHLYVFSGKNSRGAFLGTSRRIERVMRGDQDAAERAFGRSKQRLADQLHDTRRRHSSTTRAAADRFAHNATVAARYTKTLQDTTRRATAALDATLATTTPPAPAPESEAPKSPIKARDLF